MNAPRVLLLAAGHGRRAGGPKALAPFGGATMLEAHLAFLDNLVGPAKVSVSIQQPWLDRCLGMSGQVRWVPVDPDASPLASLQALIRAGRVERSFVYHVDMPIFAPAVFEKLAGAAGDVVPSFNGKRGHPVLLGVPTLLEVLRLNPANDRLDEFLGKRGVVDVPVETDVILKNDNEGSTKSAAA